VNRAGIAGGIGWFSTTVGLLQLISGFVAGLLWDKVGHAAVFYFGFGSAALGALALLLLVPSRRSPNVAVAPEGGAYMMSNGKSKLPSSG
jgi:hypothetical protein